MTSTSSEPLPEQADRTATGHDVLAPVPRWNIPGLAPAGNLRSSLRDMLVFTESILHPTRTVLDRDLAAGVRHRRNLDGSDTDIGLGWKIDRHHDRDIVWHNAGTLDTSSTGPISSSAATSCDSIALGNPRLPESDEYQRSFP